MASPAVDFARNNQQRFLNELKDLLRIPSVSTLDEHKPDIQKAANYVANELRRIGMRGVPHPSRVLRRFVTTDLDRHDSTHGCARNSSFSHSPV